ncbi:MAG: hypothetical protein QF440_02630 [Candidatus Thalassarchaeaceae archaeon]|jgi:predicted regulator of Ras-like GTPase activity (Roadblock/LC7/MglB family)|nr:hypothetical protein [Candidatus Thalassarchaeaceae archaeon]
MLNRLLSTLDEIEGVNGASILNADGTPVVTTGEKPPVGALYAELLHDAARMASVLNLGVIDQLWLESENKRRVVSTLRGGGSIWIASSVTTPIGRLRHEAQALNPIIEDLIEA